MDILRAEREEPNGPRPLAVYVHIPFCASKCHFCDWVIDIPVRQLRQQAAERQPYIDALCRQIEHYGPTMMERGYVPQVMYWGGGTPGRLSPEEMVQIREALGHAMDLSTLQEWTIETTPNDVSVDKLRTL